MISIVPLRGAGKVTFGMTRDEVERAIGRAPRRRMRLSRFDLSEIDFYDEFSVYYDASDKSCAVEFSRGGAEVEYDGFELFAHSADEVRTWARAKDQDLEEKDGFVSIALGLSMYAPTIDEPDLNDDERAEGAQSFLVCRPGYYEEERNRLGLSREGD